jgi:hypothetical protein
LPYASNLLYNEQRNKQKRNSSQFFERGYKPMTLSEIFANAKVGDEYTNKAFEGTLYIVEGGIELSHSRFNFPNDGWKKAIKPHITKVNIAWAIGYTMLDKNYCIANGEPSAGSVLYWNGNVLTWYGVHVNKPFLYCETGKKAEFCTPNHLVDIYRVDDVVPENKR